MTTKDGQWIKGHFTQEEEARIRHSLATEDVLPVCPRCGETLTCNMPRGGRCSRHDVWILECEGCLLCIRIEDEFKAVQEEW